MVFLPQQMELAAKARRQLGTGEEEETVTTDEEPRYKSISELGGTCEEQKHGVERQGGSSWALTRPLSEKEEDRATKARRALMRGVHNVFEPAATRKASTTATPRDTPLQATREVMGNEKADHTSSVLTSEEPNILAPTGRRKAFAMRATNHALVEAAARYSEDALAQRLEKKKTSTEERESREESAICTCVPTNGCFQRPHTHIYCARPGCNSMTDVTKPFAHTPADFIWWAHRYFDGGHSSLGYTKLRCNIKLWLVPLVIDANQRLLLRRVTSYGTNRPPRWDPPAWNVFPVNDNAQSESVLEQSKPREGFSGQGLGRLSPLLDQATRHKQGTKVLRIEDMQYTHSLDTIMLKTLDESVMYPCWEKLKTGDLEPREYVKDVISFESSTVVVVLRIFVMTRWWVSMLISRTGPVSWIAHDELQSGAVKLETEHLEGAITAALNIVTCPIHGRHTKDQLGRGTDGREVP